MARYNFLDWFKRKRSPSIAEKQRIYSTMPISDKGHSNLEKKVSNIGINPNESNSIENYIMAFYKMAVDEIYKVKSGKGKLNQKQTGIAIKNAELYLAMTLQLAKAYEQLEQSNYKKKTIADKVHGLFNKSPYAQLQPTYRL